MLDGPLSAIQTQLVHLLKAGHKLSVRWDCGGDESFVYTKIDDSELKANYSSDNDLSVLMDEYITELLDLPAAGEFSMQGDGRIFQEGKEIIIDYKSRATTYWDDDDSWKDYLSDEQLADIGVSPREKEPLPTEVSNSIESQPLTSEVDTPIDSVASGDEEDEQGGTYDPDMSDDYSGRRILFTLP